jgi:hypothetical protein
MDRPDDRTGIFHTFPNGETREIIVELLDPALVELYRSWTPAQRLQAADEICRSVRRQMTDEVTRQHPDWSQEQVRREVAKRFMGPDAWRSLGNSE